MIESKGRVRGSDALRAMWKERGEAIDDRTVELIASHFDGFEAVETQRTDGGFTATFATDDPERCGNTVRELLGLKPRFPFHVRLFPKGIPWPEEFLVEIVAGQQQGR